MHWILSPEPGNIPPPVPPIEELLTDPQFLRTSCLTWLRQALVITKQARDTVAHLTQGQRTDALWCQLRKLRITASNFGPVLAAIRRNTFPASLKKRLMSAYDLSGVHSIVWGITHEKEAVSAYEALGAKTEQTGLWLHECGVLGASPDGLVVCPPTKAQAIFCQGGNAATVAPGIVEVKCPYAARDMTVTEAAAKLKNFFIRDANGCLFLHEEHDYYHQVQGQLYMTDVDVCDFVVWTTKDIQIIRVGKDSQWRANIAKLTDFYFSKFLPLFV